MMTASVILLGLGLCFEAYAHALLRRRVARLEAATLREVRTLHDRISQVGRNP